MKTLLRNKLLFSITVLFLFASCKTDKLLTDATYFGGKIVNPKADQVFFYKDGEVLDSVSLSEESKFMFKFDTISEGIYSFYHGDEYQFVFLKPNDSLLLHLNTWDFDESLVFSGSGSERNNLLINLFLVNEKEDKLFYDFYKLENVAFEKVIDSLMSVKQSIYEKFKQEANDEDISPLYDKYTNALIEFPLYIKKEFYPHLHQKYLALDKHPELDAHFYNFRDQIDFNDKDLATFYPFREYMRTYINHLSYDKYLSNGKDRPVSLYYLKEASEKVNNLKLRNSLLDEAMWNLCLLSELSTDHLEEAKNVFYKNCDDAKIRNDIDNIIKAKEALPINTNLPELIVYNNSFNKLRLNDVVKGHKAVIYFWPKKSRQVENLSKRVHYLEKQYPEVLFVGINAKYPTKNWHALLNEKQFNMKNQFLLDKEVANEWLHFDFSRAILINKEGSVKNGFTHLDTRNFEQQLKAFD